jgi:hypothetical protein
MNSLQKRLFNLIAIQLLPTHVGVGLLLKCYLMSLTLLFARCWRPTLWVSVVVNSFCTFTKHVYCWSARVGLKSTSKYIPISTSPQLKKRLTPTLTNQLLARVVVHEN